MGGGSRPHLQHLPACGVRAGGSPHPLPRAMLEETQEASEGQEEAEERPRCGPGLMDQALSCCPLPRRLSCWGHRLWSAVQRQLTAPPCLPGDMEPAPVSTVSPKCDFPTSLITLGTPGSYRHRVHRESRLPTQPSPQPLGTSFVLSPHHQVRITMDL